MKLYGVCAKTVLTVVLLLMITAKALYFTEEVSEDASSVSVLEDVVENKVEKPTWIKAVPAGFYSRKIAWKSVDDIDGYQLEYGTNRFLMNSRKFELNADKSFWKAGDIPLSKPLFARVRAFVKTDNKVVYSQWTETANTTEKSYVVYDRAEDEKGIYELRNRLGQSMYGYDTVQGGCTDGTFAYYLMYNRRIESCKLAKVRLSDGTVEAVSLPLPVDHGNDITYNPNTRELIVSNCRVHINRFTVINADTLKVVRKSDVTIPQNIAGFCAITYDPESDTYISVTKGKIGFAVMDSDFKIKKLIPMTGKPKGYIWQSLDSTENYLLAGLSPKAGSGNRYNIIAVFDRQGRLITSIQLLESLELENVFHVGTRFYTAYYSAVRKNQSLIRNNYIYIFDTEDERPMMKNSILLPPAPYGIKASTHAAETDLSWSKASFGTGYIIYRAEEKQGNFKCIKVIRDLNTTTYTDKKPDNKKTYRYRLRTYEFSKGRIHYSRYSDLSTITTE
ncbi:MAG: hypothetical protein PUB87_09270 [Eubacteriaceae bacterium]|nr:hypothetical protein [Eubacteriaceae bacterium]